MYTRMLERVDKMYLREASLFLKMALSERPLSILELALTSYPGLEDMLLSANEISEQQVVFLCRSTENKLITRCVGLLEVHENHDQEVTDQKDTDQGDTEHWRKIGRSLSSLHRSRHDLCLPPLLLSETQQYTIGLG